MIAKINSSSSTCNLDSVNFDKPVGLENEHPGYTSESRGSDHLVDLLQAIQSSACAKDTMVVVTYDEFGGQWDHVSPPGQGGTPGPHDLWGPGTRIPALVVSPFLRGNFVVDHTQYDTTSILSTIEERYGLAPLSSRDAAVNSLSNVFAAKQYEAAK
jgi:phospholipase C